MRETRRAGVRGAGVRETRIALITVPKPNPILQNVHVLQSDAKQLRSAKLRYPIQFCKITVPRFRKDTVPRFRKDTVPRFRKGTVPLTNNWRLSSHDTTRQPHTGTVLQLPAASLTRVLLASSGGTCQGLR